MGYAGAALIIALCALIGAALFRLRGDGWLRTVRPAWWGTQHGRALWSLIAVPAVLLTGAEWWLALALPPALFLGCIFGWPDSLDMGTQTHSLARDIGAHSLRGLVWTLPAGAVLWLAGHEAGSILVGLSGVAAGPLYALAMLVSLRLRIGPVWVSRQDGNGVNTELGEVLFGAWIGAALAIGLSL